MARASALRVLVPRLKTPGLVVLPLNARVADVARAVVGDDAQFVAHDLDPAAA